MQGCYPDAHPCEFAGSEGPCWQREEGWSGETSKTPAPSKPLRIRYNASVVAARTNASGAPLWPFGAGLSYTTFNLSGNCPAYPPTTTGAVRTLRISDADPGAAIQCTATVTNTGTRDGDEVRVHSVVVQGWGVRGEEHSPQLPTGKSTLHDRYPPLPPTLRHTQVVTVFLVPDAARVAAGRAAAAAGGPRRDPLASRLLVAFERVTVPAGGRVDIPFNFSAPAFATVDDDGARVVRPGRYALRFSRGHGDDVDVPVDVEVGGGVERRVLRAYPRWW